MGEQAAIYGVAQSRTRLMPLSSSSSKVTADGNCSLEIKRHLLLGRKVMTNLDTVCIKKPRHLFADKGPYIQSYDFSSSCV